MLSDSYYFLRKSPYNTYSYHIQIREMGWHSWPGWQSSLGTRYQLEERAGQHRIDRSLKEKSHLTSFLVLWKGGRTSIVTGSTGVGGSVTFTGGLDPDDAKKGCKCQPREGSNELCIKYLRINEGITSAGGGACAETSALDIAPVTFSGS